MDILEEELKEILFQLSVELNEELEKGDNEEKRGYKMFVALLAD